MNRKLALLLKTILFVQLSMNTTVGYADVLKIAVASNFSNTVRQISRAFESSTGHTIKISAASSGKHYAQIKQGAPFDVFLSADQARPKMLLEEGFATNGTAKTYAIGRLVLWADQDFHQQLSMAVLESPQIQRIAIANPLFAPYGQAALQAIQSSGLATDVRKKIVRGENIGQAFQFVVSQNAQLGLLALSQTKLIDSGNTWLISEHLYSPIRQDALALNDRQATKDFMSFLLSNKAQQIIRESGYKSP